MKILFPYIFILFFSLSYFNIANGEYELVDTLIMDSYSFGQEGYIDFDPIYENYVSSGNSESNIEGNFEDYKEELSLYNLTNHDCKFISNFYKSSDGNNIYFACGKLLENRTYADWTIYINGDIIEGDFNGPAITRISVEDDLLLVDIVVSYFVGVGKRLEYRKVDSNLNDYDLAKTELLKTKEGRKYKSRFDILVNKLNKQKLLEINNRLNNIDRNNKLFNKYKYLVIYLEYKINTRLEEKSINNLETNKCTKIGDYFISEIKNNYCDLNDVIVCSDKSKGFMISRCNLGTNISGFGESSFGEYYTSNEAIKNKCYNGYYTPSKKDYEDVLSALENQNITSILKIPMGGRIIESGLAYVNISASYWTSELSNQLYVTNNYVGMGGNSYEYKFNVRCFKEQ